MEIINFLTNSLAVLISRLFCSVMRAWLAADLPAWTSLRRLGAGPDAVASEPEAGPAKGSKDERKADDCA